MKRGDGELPDLLNDNDNLKDKFTTVRNVSQIICS